MDIDGYIWLVPFIKSEDEIFLKQHSQVENIQKNILRAAMTEKYKLDKEEQEILSLFESGKLCRTNSVMQDKITAKALAIQHNHKDARINIRISQFDLDRIKRIAAKEGLPYQTLISSMIHKYVANI